jgi:hypothetical protein
MDWGRHEPVKLFARETATGEDVDLAAISMKMGFARTMILVSVPVALLGGCQSAPPPQDMARTSLQTAPADLQLICANAAATNAGTDASKVLPISSRQVDATTFAVDLDAGGRKFSCVVDNAGTVRSIGPLTTPPAAQ